MSNTTFIPESGLTTEKPLNVQSVNQSPTRTAPGISAPPAVVKEADRVSDELSALGNAINSKGHPVGKYHSFFYELLTWKHPRASGLIATTLLSSIIFTQSVNVPKFIFRILWIGLASSFTLEVAGRFMFKGDRGFVSQFAPQDYFTVSREAMNPIFNEVFSLLNFGVTEFQRLLFARNVRHTSIAFVASFVAYNLIKFLPLWALTMIGIVLAFTLPPVYIRHQQTIDAHINQASELGAAHYNNAVDAASKHASVASEKVKLVAIDLGNKAGVDVNKYIAGPGPVQSTSVLDELSKQPKTNTMTTKASDLVAPELTQASSVLSSNEVHLSEKSEYASPAIPRTTANPPPLVDAVPHI